MNDTVYGVSPGLVLHEMYTVGCVDLGAPSLTIVTCVTVGANIVRPQHDRSLCRERPRTRLTITREHTVNLQMVRRGHTPGHLLLRLRRNSPWRTLRYTFHTVISHCEEG